MANLLMHPTADSLTFLFTTQSRCERRELRKEERKGRKHRTPFFLSIICSCLVQTVVVVYREVLFSRLVGLTSDRKAVNKRW